MFVNRHLRYNSPKGYEHDDTGVGLGDFKILSQMPVYSNGAPLFAKRDALKKSFP